MKPIHIAIIVAVFVIWSFVHMYQVRKESREEYTAKRNSEVEWSETVIDTWKISSSQVVFRKLGARMDGVVVWTNEIRKVDEK